MTTRRTLLACLAALPALAVLTAHAGVGPTRIETAGRTASESRPIGNFTSIGLAIPGKVELRQGSPAAVTVEADEKVLPEIETVVENDRLHVRYRQSVDVRGNAAIRLVVTAPRIGALSIAGSGDIAAQSLATPALDVRIGGSGDVRIARLEADSLTVAIAGSGDVRVAGRAGSVQAKIAGSGSLDAGTLDSKKARLSIAGSGDATVWAREALEASIVGSGDVRYHGDPSITKRIVGSGTLRSLGPAP